MKNWTIDSTSSEKFVLLDINKQTIRRKLLSWKYFYDIMIPVFETRMGEEIRIDGRGNIFLN